MDGHRLVFCGPLGHGSNANGGPRIPARPIHQPALLTLVLGWLLAAFAGKVTAKVFKALGFDVIFERFGVRKLLVKSDVTKAPSSIVGLFLYWVLLWTTVIMTFDRLEFSAASDMMRAIANWIPSALLAVVLLGLGVVLGRWLCGLASRGARLSGVPFYHAIDHLVRCVIFLVAAVVALDQVELASTSALLTGLVVLTVISALVGLGLAVVAKDFVTNVFARQVVAREFRIGERIRIADVEGEICSLGATGVRLRSNDLEFLIPHNRLISEVVIRERGPL